MAKNIAMEFSSTTDPMLSSLQRVSVTPTSPPTTAAHSRLIAPFIALAVGDTECFWWSRGVQWLVAVFSGPGPGVQPPHDPDRHGQDEGAPAGPRDAHWPHVQVLPVLHVLPHTHAPTHTHVHMCMNPHMYTHTRMKNHTHTHEKHTLTHMKTTHSHTHEKHTHTHMKNTLTHAWKTHSHTWKTHSHTWKTHSHTCKTHTHTHAIPHVHPLTHECMRTHKQAQMHKHMHTQTHTYTRAHMCTHTHTWAHTRTHTHWLPCMNNTDKQPDLTGHSIYNPKNRIIKYDIITLGTYSFSLMRVLSFYSISFFFIWSDKFALLCFQ